MSDVTPMVGPVYGWRTWSLEATGSKWSGQQHRLRSYGGTVWTEPTRHARCLDRDPMAVMGSLFGARSEPVRERHEHEPVTDPSCWCGLYAHGTLARCLDNRESALSWGPFLKPWWDGRRPPTSVLGLVSASGRIIAAERGFRAQTMSIDTLVCLHHRGREQPHVRQVARSLGVPLVCARLTKRSLQRRFAAREGVYLWQEEAPWTSDVTSESSTSSTSPTPQGVNRSGLGVPFQLPNYAPPLWLSGPAVTTSPESDDDEAGEERADG